MTAEIEAEEEMQVDLAEMRRKLFKAKAKVAASTPFRPTARELFKAEESPEGSPGWDLVNDLSPEEYQMIAKRRQKAAVAKSKRDGQKALTGEMADFPSLSHVWSNEVAYNMVFSLASRMKVFLWKKLLWQLRVKKAVEMTVGAQGARWKRNPRWLAKLLGKEVAAMWGHYGAMRQKLHNPEVFHLM